MMSEAPASKVSPLHLPLKKKMHTTIKRWMGENKQDKSKVKFKSRGIYYTFENISF